MACVDLSSCLRWRSRTLTTILYILWRFGTLSQSERERERASGRAKYLFRCVQFAHKTRNPKYAQVEGSKKRSKLYVGAIEFDDALWDGLWTCDFVGATLWPCFGVRAGACLCVGGVSTTGESSVCIANNNYAVRTASGVRCSHRDDGEVVFHTQSRREESIRIETSPGRRTPSESHPISLADTVHGVSAHRIGHRRRGSRSPNGGNMCAWPTRIRSIIYNCVVSYISVE